MTEQTENMETEVTETSQTDTSEKESSASMEAKQTTEGKMGVEPEKSTVTTDASVTEPPPWSPNFKFKVKDKEHEIEDLFKPIVKDKTAEAKVRELYEKAYGLEDVKADRQTLKDQLKDIQTKYSTVEQNLQTIGAYARKGDFGTFFHLLNIPKEKIIQYAIEELKYSELPAEQRAAIDQQRKMQVDYDTQVQQNQSLQKQMSDLATQQATVELNQALAAPDSVPLIAAFDTRAGKPGAFKAEVIRRGQYYEAVHKISPPASQLVAEVLSLVGVQAPPAPQSTGATSTTTPGQGVEQTQKPVIKSFSGSSTKSPVQKVPTSIEDLKKIRQQRVQQNA